MKVINIHKRPIPQPAAILGEMLQTLATDKDMLLATDKWPRMRLDKGLQVGSKGGHGPIRYFVKAYVSGKAVTFEFAMKGFDGIHRFDIKAIDADNSELVHIIDMKTSGLGTVKWALAIRWLHDAFIEDAFDKVENHFTSNSAKSNWSLWVRLLRKVMSKGRKGKSKLKVNN
jgi:hypothetical protein